MQKKNTGISLVCLFLLLGQDLYGWVFNNPHKEPPSSNSYFTDFTSPPKTLDPARAYSSDEMVFIEQIYEPPFEYHYLKRPYTLIPLTASEMPEITYLTKEGKKLKELPSDISEIAYTLYDIKIKPGLYYQNHPSLAKKKTGEYYYHSLKAEDLEEIDQLQDFKEQGTRELVAEDYVYQIKRLAHPEVSSPIYGIMTGYIEGLKELSEILKKAHEENEKKEIHFLDLRKFDLSGVKTLSKYHYQIKVKGVYSQFIYWLSMPFFSPMPWEADLFYSSPDMDEKNITLDWYPVGTGPYFMEENNPNKTMILSRNKNFRHATYPEEGEEGDREKGFLDLAGQEIPFIDRFIFSLEKENIPRWSKFLQGYYDKSAVTSDSFDQAIKIDASGNAILTESIKKKGISLRTTVATATYYMGFNMLDPVVGGLSERAKKLRQAISIALDYEEYISIFLNGRGVSAQSPIPPGIFGYQEGPSGINPLVFEWNQKTGRPRRHPLEKAKQLMKEAGYPEGIDPKTGELLILNYDVTSRGNPGEKSILNWMRKQYAKLGIQLNIRTTQYNRFREKVATGNAQIFSWGWLADYPDPENFLFLLYGPNGKVKHGGENATNYENEEFDRLFHIMRNLENGEERQKIIRRMLSILREDAPWLWGYHPVDFTLSHSWNSPAKSHSMTNNLYKYFHIDLKKRKEMRAKWNEASLTPLFFLLGAFILLLIPLIFVYRRRENSTTIKRL